MTVKTSVDWIVLSSRFPLLVFLSFVNLLSREHPHLKKGRRVISMMETTVWLPISGAEAGLEGVLKFRIREMPETCDFY